MWGWFGGAAAQKRRDAPKKAILGLREQLDMLQKRERYLEAQMADADATARKNISTNKTAAKVALRRKKLHEKTLEQTSAQITQIEQQIYSIEAANINQETLNAMRNAGKAMKEIHGGMTIDEVDKTMDELREQQQLGEEIAGAIQNASMGEAIDESALEEELEGLEQEALDEKMLRTGTVPVGGELSRVPAVPGGAISNKPAAADEDEEEELRKLQAEMAM